MTDRHQDIKDDGACRATEDKKKEDRSIWYEDLKTLVDEINDYDNRKSLSDEYLSKNGHITRKDFGLGEWKYGIVTIPVDYVLPHLQKVLDLEQELKQAREEIKYHSTNYDNAVEQYGFLNAEKNELKQRCAELEEALKNIAYCKTYFILNNPQHLVNLALHALNKEKGK